MKSNDNVLHIYVKSETGQGYIAPKDLRCFNSTMATIEGSGGGLGISSSTTYTLRYEDEKIINIIKKYAAWARIKFQVHDIAIGKEMKDAKSAGIRTAPAIFFKGRVFTSVPSEEDALLRGLGVSEKDRIVLISTEPVLTAMVKGDASCASCGSKNLEMYPDGSGFCKGCNKIFHTM
jgi:hypothetical protein